jgi:hypothetical protein
MDEEIAEIRNLILTNGETPKRGEARSFKDAAHIGELMQAFADKYGLDQLVLARNKNVFGVCKPACYNYLQAWNKKHLAIAECDKRGWNYDELGYTKGLDLVRKLSKAEIKKEIEPPWRVKPRNELLKDDKELIRSFVFDGKTRKEKTQRRRECAAQYKVSMRYITSITCEYKKTPVISEPPKEEKLPTADIARILFYLQNFISKYDTMDIITLVNDVKKAAEQCGGFDELRGILPALIRPERKSVKAIAKEHNNAQTRDGIPKEQQSLKSVVYDIISNHKDGISLRQIIEEIPLTGYKSHAKKLDGVVSQALNALLAGKEVNNMPQPHTRARLYKVSHKLELKHEVHSQ